MSEMRQAVGDRYPWNVSFLLLKFQREKNPVARRWKNMERYGPGSFGTPEKNNLLTVHDEDTRDVRGLEGDTSQQMSRKGTCASLSVCWCPTLAPQGITKETLLIGKN